MKNGCYKYAELYCTVFDYFHAESKGKEAVKLFKDVLGFQDVEQFVDLTRSEIVEKLGELKQIATKFE